MIVMKNKRKCDLVFNEVSCNLRKNYLSDSIVGSIHSGMEFTNANK